MRVYFMILPDALLKYGRELAISTSVQSSVVASRFSSGADLAPRPLFQRSVMHIEKRTVARLPRGYSITLVPATTAGGVPGFLAGSEGNAELLYLEPPTFRPKVIA